MNKQKYCKFEKNNNKNKQFDITISLLWKTHKGT